MAAPMKNENLISVREFLSKWDNDVYQNCAEESTSDANTLAEKIGMSVDNVKELEHVCSIDKLQHDEEGVSEFDAYCNLESIPLDAKLMCLSFQKQEIEKRRKNRPYYASVTRKMKYKKTDEHLVYNGSKLEYQQKKQLISAENKVVYPDVLLLAHVHRPMKIKHKKRASYEENARLPSNMSNSWLVLGRQKLTDLRDSIRCVNDLTIPGDLSENPDIENQYAKDIFKSGFFFIEDTFYNDMRESDVRDYSLEIRQWSSERGKTYKTAKLEETTFLDLKLELGKPYLYMHQGDCEHIIVFSDIRLLTTEDPQDVTMYPFMTRRCSRRRTVCRLCNNVAARWIVYNSQFTPENPSFLCDLCFRSLHYDIDNKKIGNFEAYKYFDQYAIV